jgi:NADP-dependent 3-hydroxy acid dehydrogenase YdfG
VPAEPSVVRWDPEGTVLITGGTGALGRLLARHLVVHYGIRHLLLAGRRGPHAPEIDVFARQLREAGAVSLSVTACDVGDREELRALLASVPAQHPLTGVFHLAGMLDDGVIEAQTRERVDAVLHAKADAAWYLHELTLDLPLATFVLFSSAAGLLGSPGQAGYAAANASLDALARYRRAAGLPAHAIAWGLWELPGGMADQVSRAGLRRLRAIGLVPLTAERGLRLLDQVLRGTDPTPVAVAVDPAALAMTADTELPPLLRGLRVASGRLTASGSLAAPAASAPPDLIQRLPTLNPEEQELALRELVLGEVARVLGHGSPAELDAGRSLTELGFDSLTAVELRNRLSAATGLRLPATLVFDHPHVRTLVAYLRAELVPEQAATPLAVLEELTQLESALAHLNLDPIGRERLAGSLSRMLAVVEGGRDTADAADDDFFDLVP